MSVQAIDWALRLVKDVTPTQKLILICLANHAGPDGTCWPSQTILSDYSGLSREAVNRNMKDLESAGLIASERRKDPDGRETAKTYRLKIAESLAVVRDDTGGAEMMGRCDPESHLTKSTTCEDQKPRSTGIIGCDSGSHRGDSGSQGGVIQDHSDCDPGSHKSLKEESSKEETKDLKAQSMSKSQKRDSDSGALSPLAEFWNSACPSLPAVREMSENRRKKEKLRLKERPDLDEWERIFRMIDESSFCRGNGRTGWRATFDWIIDNPDNAIKVLEGKYENYKNGRPKDISEMSDEEVVAFLNEPRERL